jgi:predicted transcriptional regulator
MTLETQLSRRERQIMDILHARGRVPAADVHAALPDAPSYSAVRALLRILEIKGYVRHEREGLRYVFMPVEPRTQASRSALKRVLDTFFGGAVDEAVEALLEVSDTPLDEADRRRLRKLIAKARKEGR